MESRGVADQKGEGVFFWLLAHYKWRTTQTPCSLSPLQHVPTFFPFHFLHLFMIKSVFCLRFQINSLRTRLLSMESLWCEREARGQLDIWDPSVRTCIEISNKRVLSFQLCGWFLLLRSKVILVLFMGVCGANCQNQCFCRQAQHHRDILSLRTGWKPAQSRALKGFELMPIFKADVPPAGGCL